MTELVEKRAWNKIDKILKFVTGKAGIPEDGLGKLKVHVIRGEESGASQDNNHINSSLNGTDTHTIHLHVQTCSNEVWINYRHKLWVDDVDSEGSSDNANVNGGIRNDNRDQKDVIDRLTKGQFLRRFWAEVEVGAGMEAA